MRKDKVKTVLGDVFFDFLAGLIFGISVNFFTAPNHIAPGGVTGAATLLNYLFHIPIGTMSFLINVPLIIISFKFLGTRFSILTMKSMTIISFMVDAVAMVFSRMGVAGYEGDRILAGLMGGVMTGGALALVFLRGSTTGGLDIISRLLKKKFPHIPMGRLLFAADFCVLSVSVLVYGNLESGLYGLIAIFTCSRMVDTLLYGGDKGKNMMIVTRYPQEISKGIKDAVNRGVTLLHAESAYTGDQMKVVMCALRDNQYPIVKKLVHTIDPQAFLIINEASEIRGYGFHPIDEEK